MLFAYLGMMLVARFLGPTDFGLISLASAVATIASTVVLIYAIGGFQEIKYMIYAWDVFKNSSRLFCSLFY